MSDSPEKKPGSGDQPKSSIPHIVETEWVDLLAIEHVGAMADVVGPELMQAVFVSAMERCPYCGGQHVTSHGLMLCQLVHREDFV